MYSQFMMHGQKHIKLYMCIYGAPSSYIVLLRNNVVQMYRRFRRSWLTGTIQ